MGDKLHLTALPLAFAMALGLAAPAGAAETTSTAPKVTKGTGTVSSTASTATLSPGESKVIGRTADTFTPFAGSRPNAENLATGLRTGNEITLTASELNGQTTSTTFTPPTKPMGYGNVSKALALSSQQLAAADVAQPTPDQIRTSLMGGTITNDAGQQVKMQGVLQMRADGMGWGQIAHQLGVKPGQGYRPAYTASGVTTASRTAGVVNAKGKQAGNASSGTDKQSRAPAGSQPSRSGIVTASGASASQGSANASSKGLSHRADSLTTAGGNPGGVTNAASQGQGGVVSAAGGSVSSGHGGGGGLAKGHAK